MATSQVLIPVEEYLRTVYRPDCDYIDGEVLERNMGETPHGCLQTFFAYFFRMHEDDWQIVALTETRLQVMKTNYRIPDVMVLSMPYQNERIIRAAPILCIEILSSEDRMSRINERLADYAAIGVNSSWVVDPWRRLAYAAGPDARPLQVDDRLTVPGTPITIEVPAIWAELDRLEQRAARTLKP